jgi:pimeloyl-ACP methyl ester carboxylesterase
MKPQLRPVARTVLLAAALIGSSTGAAAQSTTPPPLESFPGVAVTIRDVPNPAGFTQRMIVTAPATARGSHPTVFVTGWLSCDPIQMPNGPGNDGFLRLIRAVIQASFTVVRVEKPGMAGSGGTCEETDFDTELAGYRAAFEAMYQLPSVDTSRIVMLGLSNGGGFAPLVAGTHRIRGFVSIGGWARTWGEHMIDLERRRMELAGKPAEEVTGAMRRWPAFYDAYVNARRLPGEIEAQTPALRGLWYDQPAHQYGRPARFYQQLQALDLAAEWSRIDAPVLAIRGDLDWIMSDEDVAPIVARRPVRPGARRTLLVLPGRDHTLGWFRSASDAFTGRGRVVRDDVNRLVVDWVRRTST